MNIYLASTFELVEIVELAAEVLEGEGHTIAVKWWAADGFNMWDKKKDHTSDAFYNDPTCRRIYEKDFNGVRNAQALVIVADGLTPTGFTGANVELGIALASNVPCFSLGMLKNSAMYWPVVRCRNFDELLEALRKAGPDPIVMEAVG